MDRDPARIGALRRRLVGRTAAVSILILAGAVSAPYAASAAEAPVGLGTVGAYSVLGGQTVTNIGPTTMSRGLGVSPGTAIVGFPPGRATGATHAGDAPAAQAQADLVTAYNDAAGRAVTASVGADLVGMTLVAGVYNATGPMGLSGALTLDGQGDPNAVFVFQASSTLITASSSSVNVINGAQACHVYWQVGSSATLGTGSSFKGTIMALTSVTVTTGVTVQGRALARNGAVTLDNDVFTSPDCAPTAAETAAAAAEAKAKAKAAKAKARAKARAARLRSASAAARAGSGGDSTTGSATPAGPELPDTGLTTATTPMLATGVLFLLLGGLLVAAARPPAYIRRH
jgi:hypothetical protein